MVVLLMISNGVCMYPPLLLRWGELHLRAHTPEQTYFPDKSSFHFYYPTTLCVPLAYPISFNTSWSREQMNAKGGCVTLASLYLWYADSRQIHHLNLSFLRACTHAAARPWGQSHVLLVMNNHSECCWLSMAEHWWWTNASKSSKMHRH